jgi:ADP-ribose pyrophosphatase
MPFNPPYNAPPNLVETQLSSTPMHQGMVIQIRKDEVRLPNGNTAWREVAEHPGGVVVLAITDVGTILFVEQFRYALGRPLLELPAGKLDPGEIPLHAIQRELMEETGYSAESWEELSQIYTAPGFCDEKLWLYRAKGLKKVYDQGTCADDPATQIEFLRCIELSPEIVFEKIRSREIVDAKTICLMSLGFHLL